MTDGAVCGAPGPWIRTRPSYEKQVMCNRTSRHAGPHRHYDRDTFAVLAEWTAPYERAEVERRKVKTAPE